MTRKELRAPDAFQRAALEIRAWISSRQGLVVGAVAVVLLAWFAVAAGRMMSEKREAKAEGKLGQALATLSRPLQADLPPGTPPDEPPFKTEQERDQAAAAALQEVRTAFPNSRAALTAALPLASVEVRLGRLDPAIGHFEDYLRNAPRGELLRVTALDGLGHAWEARGELPKALEAYERMAREEASGFLAGMGAYHRARMLAALGKKQEAAQAFAEVIAANAGTPAARLGQERLSDLEGQGFKASVAARPDAG